MKQGVICASLQSTTTACQRCACSLGSELSGDAASFWAAFIVKLWLRCICMVIGMGERDGLRALIVMSLLQSCR